MKMNRNARITLIMTTAVCLAILATAAIINTILGAGMAIKAGALFERIRFYVPFLYLEAANTIVNELFSADEYAENKG